MATLVVVDELPVMIQFLSILLVAPSDALALAIQITALPDMAVFVLVMVRFLEEVPLLEPSIVTLSAPFNLMIAAALLPVKVEVTPLPGLIRIEYGPAAHPLDEDEFKAFAPDSVIE